MLERGVILDKRYELERELGRGGAAIVFRARDRKLDRDVAVKALIEGGPVGDRERFLQEARALAELSHPHIVDVYEIGEDHGVPYLVVEFAEDGNLLHRIPRKGMASGLVLRYSRQVLAALEYAHENGVLHRDIKPENVLLAADGTAKLADFGLAKRRDEGVDTATGVVMGTPEFLAPEVLRGEKASPASDVFSWGCLSLFLANGRPPHEGTALAIYQGRVDGKYDLSRLKGPMRTAVEQALRVEPGRRPSAQELMERIEGELTSPSEELREAITVRTSLKSSGLDGLTASRVVERGSARWWAGWATGAAALLLVLGALAQWGTSPAIVPPATRLPSMHPVEPPTRSGSSSDLPPVLLSRWRTRLGRFQPAERLAALQQRVFPKPEGVLEPALASHVHVMGLARKGKPPEGSHLGELHAARARLPWRGELDEDRGALRRLLASDGVPLEQRLEVHDLLERLRSVDAYFEGWGEEPPYLAEDLLGELLPRSLGEKTGLGPAPPVPHGKDPAPGRYGLFRWTREADRRRPYLFSPGPELSTPEMLARATAEGAEGPDSWSFEEHQELLGRIHLERPGRYRKAILEVAIANMLVPNRLVVTWNGRPLVYHPSPERFHRVIWGEEAKPWRRVRFELPSGLLQAGWNRVRVVTEPLPGMERWGCMWADDVAIELED